MIPMCLDAFGLTSKSLDASPSYLDVNRLRNIHNNTKPHLQACPLGSLPQTAAVPIYNSSNNEQLYTPPPRSQAFQNNTHEAQFMIKHLGHKS